MKQMINNHREIESLHDFIYFDKATGKIVIKKPIVDGEGQNIGGIKLEQICNPAQYHASYDDTDYYGNVDFSMTLEQYRKMMSAKFIVFAMNGTFVMTPLAQHGDTLSCNSFAYDSEGNTMVVRIRFIPQGEETHSLRVKFDENFAEHTYGQEFNPYAILMGLDF